MAKTINQVTDRSTLKMLERARAQLVCNGMLNEQENRNVKKRIKAWYDGRQKLRATPKSLDLVL